MRKGYTVTDGKIVLTLERAEEGGYVVTSPVHPEAFSDARDALKALLRSRAKLIRRLAATA